MSIEVIIFYLFLVDSIICNLMVLFNSQWYEKLYTKYLPAFSWWFPLRGGWTLCYLLFVLWVGSLLFRLGVLF